jgi:membrane-associated phospholipid phosphatase
MTFFAKGRDRFWGAVGLAVLCVGGFAATCLFNVARHGLEQAPVIQAFRMDAVIPFAPGWIWIYLLYYPFCFLPLFLREVREDPGTFTRTILAFGLQFGASFFIFLVWPLRMAHPALPAGLEGSILKHLYACDLGFNSFPSLHVANIVFVSLLYWRMRGARWGAALAALAALISASTMLVKQHFVADVAAGALLGWLSFIIAFSRRPAAH